MDGIDALSIGVLLILLILFSGALAVLFRAQSSGHRRGVGRKKAPEPKTSPCPVCGSPLRKGERVRSVVYQNPGLKRVHIFGCAYCYGDSTKLTRFCPVCRKSLAAEAYLVAWMREQDESVHVRVIGCTACERKGVRS